MPQVVRDDGRFARTSRARGREGACVGRVLAVRERRQRVLGKAEVEVVRRALELRVDLEAPRRVGDERRVELERERCRVARRVLGLDAEPSPVRRVREERIVAHAVVVEVSSRPAADSVQRVRAEERQPRHVEALALLRDVRIAHPLLLRDERREGRGTSLFRRLLCRGSSRDERDRGVNEDDERNREARRHERWSDTNVKNS